MLRRIMISCLLLFLLQVLNIVLPPELQPQTMIKSAQSYLRNEPGPNNNLAGCICC